MFVKTCLSRFKGVETTMARAREASDTVVVPSRPLSAPAQSGSSGKKRRRAPIQTQARCQCIESKMSQKLHKDLKSRGVGIESEEAEKENDAVDGMEDWMRGLMEVHPFLKMLPENIRCRLARLAMNKLRQRDGISMHWLDRRKAFHFKNDSTRPRGCGPLWSRSTLAVKDDVMLWRTILTEKRAREHPMDTGLLTTFGGDLPLSIPEVEPFLDWCENMLRRGWWRRWRMYLLCDVMETQVKGEKLRMRATSRSFKRPEDDDGAADHEGEHHEAELKRHHRSGQSRTGNGDEIEDGWIPFDLRQHRLRTGLCGHHNRREKICLHVSDRGSKKDACVQKPKLDSEVNSVLKEKEALQRRSCKGASMKDGMDGEPD